MSRSRLRIDRSQTTPQPASSNGSIRKLRSTVYTRKSTDEGLDMDFNSLDAQRESCESYISSQKRKVGC